MIQKEPDVNEFLKPNTVYALAADCSSPDTVWFTVIHTEAIASKINYYGITITESEKFFKGGYLWESHWDYKGTPVQINKENNILILGKCCLCICKF